MKFFTTFLFTLFFFQINAQIWDKTLTDEILIKSSTSTSDGGSIMLGIPSTTTSNQIIVLKIDAAGSRQWIKQFTDISYSNEPVSTGKIRIVQDSDGSYWFSVAQVYNIPFQLVKLDNNGNRLFFKTLPLLSSEIGVSGNECLVFGRTINNVWTLLKFKTNGDTTTVKNFPEIKSLARAVVNSCSFQKSSFIFYAFEDSTFVMNTRKIGFDGTLIARNIMPASDFHVSPIAPSISTLDGGFLVPDSLSMTKLDSMGRFVWRKIIGISNLVPLNPPIYYHYLFAATTSDGGFLGIQNNPALKNLEIRKFSPDGTLQSSNFWSYSNTITFPSLVKMKNSGYLLACRDSSNKTRLIRFNEYGYFYPYFIKGNIFSDRDDNCRISGGDIGIQRVIVVAKKTGQPDILALSDSNGRYNLNVDVGTYTVSIVNPNNFMIPCTPSVTKTISTSNPLDSFDFPLKSTFYCGLMQVDVATPRLRRCFNNNYTVNYCNKGTATATNAYVNITLDPLLEFTSSDKPVAAVNGRTYRFNLGDVAINDCRTFDIVARVRCGDSTRLGQTLCVDAKIFPDTLCAVDSSFWSGASLVIDGSCQGDSVTFQIRNVGRATSSSLQAITIENETARQYNNIQLAVNGVFTKKYPANGNTWRMSVNQQANHPRSTQPTAFVEGCRSNGSTSFVTGFAANFSNDDADISFDKDCQPIIGAFDPNDKIGYPIGTGTTKAIGQNQDIEYMIRFQNTGTDTAFTVVIRDTIDANLDLYSIQWGASSHKYKPEIYGQNIVKFTFDNILLVDSFTNEVKSNGYVKYRIKQKKDVAFGTKIQNSAGIYFDFNDPVLTNKTLHTVSKNLISAIFDRPTTSNVSVKLFPNPATEIAYFELTDTPLSKTTFELFDLAGKRIKIEQFDGKTFEFHRGALQSGIYVFKFKAGSAIVGTGKLIIQ